MAIKLIANIEDHGNAGYVAWIDSIKGMVVQSNSIEGVCMELFTSIKVKLAHDFGISASEIQEITEDEAKNFQREVVLKRIGKDKNEICKKEISLTLS